jgi:hypothetical protein
MSISHQLPWVPPGKKLIRLDGGDSSTPWRDRVYTLIDAGFGENTRIARVKPAHLRKKRKRI